MDDPTEDDESEGQEAEEGEEVAPDGARYPGFGQGRLPRSTGVALGRLWTTLSRLI